MYNQLKLFSNLVLKIKTIGGHKLVPVEFSLSLLLLERDNDMFYYHLFLLLKGPFTYLGNFGVN